MVYEGYEFQVPASWPVYRLDEHPTTCVRYDVHAVYLGQPSASMQCPAGLVGRTETVNFIPDQAGAQAGVKSSGKSGTGISYQRAQLAAADGVALRRLPAVGATLTENATQDELTVALGAVATVLGTYATSPAVMEKVLETLRPAPASAPATQQTAPAHALAQQPVPAGASPAAQNPGAKAPAAQGPAPAAPGGKSPKSRSIKKAKKKARKAAPASSVYTSWHGVPANWPVQVIQPPPPAPPRPVLQPVAGFDTCDLLTAAMLRAWRSQYSVVGKYIGGVNAGCPPDTMSASWVQAAESMGWGILPTYVGPQAPCWRGAGAQIVPGQAAAQGTATAIDAVNDARLLGLKPGSPVYYDMEGYKVPDASCTSAVLTFLGAWDRRVTADGYVSGVYSSLDSGIRDLESGVVNHAKGYTAPKAIWIADWKSGPVTLDDGQLAWPLYDRSKQYAGNVSASVGGHSLYIDQDYVGGPVAH